MRAFVCRFLISQVVMPTNDSGPNNLGSFAPLPTVRHSPLPMRKMISAASMNGIGQMALAFYRRTPPSTVAMFRKSPLCENSSSVSDCPCSPNFGRVCCLREESEATVDHLACGAST